VTSSWSFIFQLPR